MILHICPQTDWDAAQSSGEYRTPSLETEGFIHCSLPEQVVAAAKRYYAGQEGLVLLVIDPDCVRPEIKPEAGKDGLFYPHIYGPLNTDAVVAVKPFPPQPDGSFLLPKLTV